MEQKEKTALYLVTCNYVFGLDYGVRFGVVGIFTTKEAAKEARKKTLEMWNDYYITKIKSESNGDEWEVSTGLYKCTKRMFDGTPESRLLFEPGNLYKCVKIHKCVTNNDVAVFESPYWLPVFLTDSIVRKHFIKV